MIGAVALFMSALDTWMRPPEPPALAAASLAPVPPPPPASFEPPGRGRRGRGGPQGPPAPIRSRIADGREGSPLALQFEILDPSGVPVPGARVEVWHADATGVYSQPPEDWCRGAQITDDQGRVAFTTIRPGGEGQRSHLPHVHFQVKTDTGMSRHGSIDVPETPGPAMDGRVISASYGPGADGIPALKVRATLELPTESCGPR